MTMRKREVVSITILVSVLITAAGWSVYSSRRIDDQRIIQHFACERFTADSRATDVFCDTDIYRNPNLSAARFRAYLQCDQVLKSVAKDPNQDVLLFVGDGEMRVSLICKDKTTLEQTRLKFNNYLKDLKAENPL